MALSYRGYWKSRGTPSQSGIELDARAGLGYARSVWPDGRVILWGQSIGAAVATTLLATHLQELGEDQRASCVAGLILETPFLSLRSMLVALYPQKWLPYRYLHPFLRSEWDNESALQSIASTKAGRQVPILLIKAGNDELVPDTQPKRLMEICEKSAMQITERSVAGALHTEASSRSIGRSEIVAFLKRVIVNNDSSI